VRGARAWVEVGVDVCNARGPDLIVASDEGWVYAAAALRIYQILAKGGERAGKYTPQASWYNRGTPFRKDWFFTQVHTLVPCGEERSRALTTAWALPISAPSTSKIVVGKCIVRCVRSVLRYKSSIQPSLARLILYRKDCTYL